MAILDLKQVTEPIFENIPEDLQTYPQFTLWKSEAKYNKQKNRTEYSKRPCDISGNFINWKDSQNLLPFQVVQEAYEKGGFNGIGFVLTDNDPFVCIDLDAESIDEIPEDKMSLVNVSYTEKSPSGNGLHIWLKGKKPDWIGTKQNGIEFFGSNRFVTVTGDVYSWLDIEKNQNFIDYVSNKYFPKEQKDPEVISINSENKSHLTDKEVLSIMFKAKNGEKIKRLFEGDISEYAYDLSSADLALCGHFAFYTNNDHEQMDRLYRMSALYQMSKKISNDGTRKWDREDYRVRTFNKAYCPKPWKPSEQHNQSEIIPKPFLVQNGALFKLKTVKVDGELQEEKVIVCRQAPYISKSFENFERSQVFYEIQWNDRGRPYKEIVPAGSLAVKKDLLKLADYGLAVNDNNAKDLIQYFDRFLTFNEINRSNMVERIGHVKKAFIHPLVSQEVEILPPDIGEKQLLEAFTVRGTVDSWKNEVFDIVKDHPKAAFMVMASFASIILKDLHLTPIIVDLSGSTSQGKTTALRAASSVWGDHNLVSEWNATKTSIERKAAFLNSFPLILDDTRKADERVLQSIIYGFSGGRSKGRGTTSGSQREFTWNNIMLTTGEVNLSEYAERAGGAAARIIQLTDQPFNNPDFKLFSKIYKAIENNHGAIGIEFIKLWQERKENELKRFDKLRDFFQEKANGNEVLQRLAIHYAAVVFTGNVVNEFFNLGFDIRLFYHLFTEIALENEATDKPMEMMKAVLMDLDSNRSSIYYTQEPFGMTKAVYRDGVLYLTPAYLKEFLKAEVHLIRREWRKRGITSEFEAKGKKVDYKQLFHNGRNLQVIPVNHQLVEELGFDFKKRERNT
ncbi:DUF927 domain-containing protein [Chungangia koreensis]|uniref:DUF927 domain-containing protein n=1 Tax=Chungangia koreensis TaxID=752657 RepID=A0ABV8X478_9LACT